MKVIPMVVAFMAVALAGCGPDAVRPTFSLSDHAMYDAAGNSTVKGQAFARQRGGGVVTCAGRPVFLMPATQFFRDAVHALVEEQIPLEAPASAPGTVKIGQCDADGRFVFTGLPAAKWLVATEVHWEAMFVSQGGVMSREFEVADGATVEALLTEANLHDM